MRDRVLFHMVNQNSGPVHRRVIGQHVQNHSRALILVFQVRRVNQYLLVVFYRQFHVLLKDCRLVGRVFI